MGIFNWLFRKTKKVSKYTSGSKNDKEENSFSDGLDKLIKEKKITRKVTPDNVWATDDELWTEIALSKERAKFAQKCLKRLDKASKYEKEGKIDLAIKLYKQNIDEKFTSTTSWDRLAIIYRKQKDYLNEIAILKNGIECFTDLLNSDIVSANRDPEWELGVIHKFEKRLEKATILLNKNEKR